MVEQREGLEGTVVMVVVVESRLERRTMWLPDGSFFLSPPKSYFRV